MKHLVTPGQVVELAFADGAYLGADALPGTAIAAVERRYLRPVVGERLYERLVEGAYADFAAEYLAPAVALRVRLAMQPRLELRTGQCGVVAAEPEGGAPPSEEQTRRLARELRAEARALMRRAAEYLDAHAADFPEYDPRENILKRCRIDGGLVQVG